MNFKSRFNIGDKVVIVIYDNDYLPKVFSAIVAQINFDESEGEPTYYFGAGVGIPKGRLTPVCSKYVFAPDDVDGIVGAIKKVYKKRNKRMRNGV